MAVASSSSSQFHTLFPSFAFIIFSRNQNFFLFWLPFQFISFRSPFPLPKLYYSAEKVRKRQKVAAELLNRSSTVDSSSILFFLPILCASGRTSYRFELCPDSLLELACPGSHLRTVSRGNRRKNEIRNKVMT